MQAAGLSNQQFITDLCVVVGQGQACAAEIDRASVNSSIGELGEAARRNITTWMSSIHDGGSAHGEFLSMKLLSAPSSRTRP